MFITISLVIAGLLGIGLVLRMAWLKFKRPPLSPSEVQALEQRIQAIELDHDGGEHQSDPRPVEALQQLIEQSNQLPTFPQESRKRLQQLSKTLSDPPSAHCLSTLERCSVQLAILSEEVKDRQRLELAKNSSDYPIVKWMVALRSELYQDLYQKLDKH